MSVDATWSLATLGTGTVVNERFVLGEDQKLACDALESWVVPDDRDAEEFKQELLQSNFTRQELEHRDAFIKALGEISIRE